MLNLMLDLETLGSNPRAPIASIGAALFDLDRGEIEETLYVRIDLASLDGHRDYFTLDYDTIKWWMSQSDEAIKSTFTGDLISLEDALRKFQDFVPSRNSTPVWGNGADFDNVILGYAYDVLGISKPWKYSNNRCFRTIKNLVGAVDMQTVTVGTKHNALDDAVWQARYLMKAMERITVEPISR